MSGFKFSLAGADKLLGKLKNAEPKIKAKVETAMMTTITDINEQQVVRAPVNTGNLRNHIGFIKTGEMEFELFANTNYAAYVEFGTGKAVSVPGELAAYAQQFKGKGFVGKIPVKIGDKWVTVTMPVSLPPRPFFFPPFFEKRKELIDKVRKVIHEL